MEGRGESRPSATQMVNHIRNSAMTRIPPCRNGAVILVLGFAVLIAWIAAVESPSWDSVAKLAYAIGIAGLCLWFGWGFVVYLQERCRKHVRQVLIETDLILKLLEQEPGVQQPALWRQALGLARFNPNAPLSFRKRLLGFISNYSALALSQEQQPFPSVLTWTSLVVHGLGNAVMIASVFFFIAYMFDCLPVEVPEIRLLVACCVTLVSYVFLFQVLHAVRRSALELAVTDVLLGEGEER